MTTEQAVQFLIEQVGEDLDPKIKVLSDRMFLQVFSVPSLQANFAEGTVLPVPGAEDGRVKIQLGFMRLPKEVLPDLERLLSARSFKNYRMVSYVKNGQARTGIEIEVSPKDLPGDQYDYAF